MNGQEQFIVGQAATFDGTGRNLQLSDSNRKGAKMSYSPPNSGKRRAAHPKWRDENVDPHFNYPLQMETQQQQRLTKKPKAKVAKKNQFKYQDHYVEPSKKNEVRFQYNNGKNNRLPSYNKPRYVAHAESRIKEHIMFYQDIYRSKKNKKLFDKEPQIMFKTHPEAYDYDPNMDTVDKEAHDGALRCRAKKQQK